MGFGGAWRGNNRVWGCPKGEQRGLGVPGGGMVGFGGAQRENSGFKAIWIENCVLGALG